MAKPSPVPPILTCARDGCENLFYQTRKDRKFCGQDCASAQWYAELSTGRRPLPVSKRNLTVKSEAADGTGQR